MTLQKAHASRCIKIHKAAHLRARSTLKYVCKRIINPLFVYGSKSSFSVGVIVWVCSLIEASNFLLSLKDSVKLNKNFKFLGNALLHLPCSMLKSAELPYSNYFWEKNITTWYVCKTKCAYEVSNKQVVLAQQFNT